MRIEPAFSVRIAELRTALGLPSGDGGEKAIGAITTNSRLVRPGDLFVALRGATADGHAYLEDARRRGASVLLSEIPTERGITVPDTREALRLLAAHLLALHRIPVVAITGSVGKTGAKDAIAAALSARYNVHRTEENRNNELGVSFTVLSRPKAAEIMVLELGTNHPGEIAAHSEAIHPSIGVITAIGSAHIGAFGSREAIFREKTAITHGMQGGRLILNRDDPYLAAWPTPLPTSCVGLRERADFFAEGISFSQYGASYQLIKEGKRQSITLGAIGRPRIYASLFAMATAHHFGVPDEDAALALSKMSYANGRQSIEAVAGITLIDDSYNASPEAVEEAIFLLSTLKAVGKRHIVLGDMLELGEHAIPHHERIGALAAKEASYLYIFGNFADAVARGARNGGMPSSAIRLFSDADGVLRALLPCITAGDTVLIKASHSLHGGRIAEGIRSRRSTPLH